MKVYLLQRLSLFGLIACCLQMGSVHAEKLTVLMERNLKSSMENISLLNSINDNLTLRTRDWTDSELLAIYDDTLLTDTKAIIRGVFKNISGEKLEEASAMRDLLIKFDESKFKNFPVGMRVAFVSIVQALAKLTNAPDSIKNLNKKLKSSKTKLDQVEAKLDPVWQQWIIDTWNSLNQEPRG